MRPCRPGSKNSKGGRADDGARIARRRGQNLRVRDAEWVVGHIERNSVSGSVVHATGLSGIVRDRPAIFVESIEKQRGRGIAVVDPTDVKLVTDASSGYEDTLLHLEAAFRKSPTGENPQVAGKAAIDDLDFQLDPVRLALSVGSHLGLRIRFE